MLYGLHVNGSLLSLSIETYTMIHIISSWNRIFTIRTLRKLLSGWVKSIYLNQKLQKLVIYCAMVVYGYWL